MYKAFERMFLFSVNRAFYQQEEEERETTETALPVWVLESIAPSEVYGLSRSPAGWEAIETFPGKAIVVQSLPPHVSKPQKH